MARKVIFHLMWPLRTCFSKSNLLTREVAHPWFRDTSRKSEEVEPMFTVILKSMVLNALMIFFLQPISVRTAWFLDSIVPVQTYVAEA